MFPALETELKQEVGTRPFQELHRNPIQGQKVDCDGMLVQPEVQFVVGFWGGRMGSVAQVGMTHSVALELAVLFLPLLPWSWDY